MFCLSIARINKKNFNTSIQLATSVNHIIKYDFPGRWTQIVDKISIYFQNPGKFRFKNRIDDFIFTLFYNLVIFTDVNGWSGALVCLYQLVKNYEYKKADERTPLNEAMNLLLPMLYQLQLTLMADASEQSVSLQHKVLKIYHALTQVSLTKKKRNINHNLQFSTYFF